MLANRKAEVALDLVPMTKVLKQNEQRLDDAIMQNGDVKTPSNGNGNK